MYIMETQCHSRLILILSVTLKFLYPEGVISSSPQIQNGFQHGDCGGMRPMCQGKHLLMLAGNSKDEW